MLFYHLLEFLTKCKQFVRVTPAVFGDNPNTVAARVAAVVKSEDHVPERKLVRLRRKYNPRDL
jgi:hypothetical protein